MNFKKISLALAVSSITFSTTTNAVLGPIPIYLNPIEINSNYFNDIDTHATFASEIYTEEDIKNSNSKNLYDFLNQNTSIAIAPSSGNRFTQKIDVRGYGLTDGYQNVVITLNGRRLNNIDTAIQDLSVININNIEKIEITKGSGSVVYGDSAMAGGIHIYTKKSVDTITTITTGNYGIHTASISAGHNQDNFDLSISVDTQKQGGFGIEDPQGNKDKGEQTNKKLGFKLYPNNTTEVLFNYTQSKLDTRYPNYLTLAQFNEDPGQNSSGRVYTHQETNYDIYNLKVKSKVNNNLDILLNTSREVKDSTNSYYLWSDITVYDTPTKNDYDYRTADISYNFKSGNIKVDSGLTTFNGERKGSSDTTTKDNIGVFAQGSYQLNDYTYSIGTRKEAINYAYNPNSGTALSDGHNLKAYDLGFNKKLNDKTTIFSNYNVAFQAPLIDRFFDWDGTFNGFMNPSRSKTVNIGLNHLTNKSKTKVTLFRSNVTDEMYYYSTGFKNTNIDKSHKQGLELQNKYQFNPKLLTNINYAYTKAIIDEENEASGSYNGKDLPMVSKHNITLSASYNIDNKSKISLTHKYRSKAFSEEDFANEKLQKQKEFKSTDISYLYKHNKDLDFTFDIENLFKNSYGTWLRDDIIYPSSFTRNIKAGLTYHF